MLVFKKILPYDCWFWWFEHKEHKPYENTSDRCVREFEIIIILRCLPTHTQEYIIGQRGWPILKFYSSAPGWGTYVWQILFRTCGLRMFFSKIFCSILDIGLAVRVFANCPGDVGSIPGRVIPKTQKMVLNASWLNTQHYKVQIKGKVEQSREKSSALPYTLV